MSDLNFFLPITKVDEDKRTISGYASTEAKDSDGETIALDAIKAALPDYMQYGNIREMHRLQAVGTAEEAHVDRKGLWLTAKISDDDAWKKVVDKVYKGFSIGGRKLDKDPSDPNKITRLAMTEISIVDRPANPECRFNMAKMDKSGSLTIEPGVRFKKVRKSKAEKLANSFAMVSEFLIKAPSQDKLIQEEKKNDVQISALKSKADGKPPFDSQTSNPLDAANTKTCSVHGVVGCPTCGEDISKREYSSDQRKEYAGKGIALPDGSYPIPDKDALGDAVQAFGRAKDKGKAKSHIKSRAAALGATDMLPEKWGKKAAAKEAKKAAQAVAVSKGISTSNEIRKSRPLAAVPSFLTLKAAERDDGAAPPVIPSWLTLGQSQEDGLGGPLSKRMEVAGSLAFCFDSIRSAQRSLLREAKGEGGDMKDKSLAKDLSSAAQILASVIGQKATHEGQEAVDLSDIDDQYLIQFLGEDFEMAATNEFDKTVGGDPLQNAILDVIKRAAQPSRAMRMKSAGDNMKKAAKARKEASGAIEDCSKLIKAYYISKMEKAAKGKAKPEDDDSDFDSAGAMEKLNKAYSELSKVSTFTKAARMQLKKMAGRSGEKEQEPTHGNAFYQVPPGVKDLSPSDLATASPGGMGRGSEPPLQALDKDWGKLAKAIGKDGRIDAATAQLFIENARLEAQNSLLARSTSGRAPYAFDMTKVIGNGENGNGRPAGDPLMKAIHDAGVSPMQLENDEGARRKVAGTYILNGGNGKSIFDPGFRGGAAGKRA